MSKKIFSLFLAVGCCLALAGQAEAARLGGGKSFGSRPSYSMPYQRQAVPPAAAPSSINKPAPAAPQQPAPAPARSGLMGMLGGLAMGGLLGAMLFGGGFHGVNFLDFLLFGAIAFLAFKFLAGRRSQPQPASGDYSAVPETHAPYQREAQGPAGFDTDILSRKGGVSGASFQQPTAVPADFDQEAFLSGAKAAYRHLQAAWDEGDSAEIRGLTTDKVFAEIQEQLRARQGDNRTELLKVEAELLEVRDLARDREASVLFDVLMRETGDERAKQIREVWHFVRPKSSTQPTWFLDGIQQLDD